MGEWSGRQRVTKERETMNEHTRGQMPGSDSCASQADGTGARAMGGGESLAIRTSTQTNAGRNEGAVQCGAFYAHLRDKGLTRMKATRSRISSCIEAGNFPIT